MALFERWKVGAKAREAFEQAKAAHAAKEWDRIDSARRSAKFMKVLGTIGLFGLGAAAAVSVVVAPYIAAPVAATVMAVADGSAVGTGISAVLALVGIAREKHNKNQLKHVEETFNLVAA